MENTSTYVSFGPMEIGSSHVCSSSYHSVSKILMFRGMALNDSF